MFSLQLYKVIHLAAIFLFIGGSSVLLTSGKRDKAWSAITGVASLFILLTGLALTHLGGFGHQPFVLGMFVIWLLVSGLGHLIAKRWPKQGKLACWAIYGLATVAAALAFFHG